VSDFSTTYPAHKQSRKKLAEVFYWAVNFRHWVSEWKIRKGEL